jgi:hypothetical protein
MILISFQVFPSKKLDSSSASPTSTADMNKTEIAVGENLENIVNIVLLE